jgi:predicted HicB family RNase H-like nuclease
MGNGTKPRPVGRPALPKGAAKAKIVPVRFRAEEFKAITRAAKDNKQTLSEWIRGTLNAKVHGNA